MKVTERSNSAGESMKNVSKLALLLWVLWVAAAMLAQSSDQPKAADAKARAASTGKPADTVQDAGASSDYVIGADDALHISVWKEPDLSEQLPVRPDGKISMQLLNDIPAAGLTPLTLLPQMTVLQALAQAGFTQFANLKAIYLLRTHNGKQQKLPFNYKEVVKGNHPEQNILLKPGDTVVVP